MSVTLGNEPAMTMSHPEEEWPGWDDGDYYYDEDDEWPVEIS